jgi:ketosteroid isomerase-like protein
MHRLNETKPGNACGLRQLLQARSRTSSEEQKMDGIIISQEKAREIANDWIDAWNSRDLERIVSHYSEDVEFSSPTVITRYGELSGILRGKAKIREHFKQGLETFGPSVGFELIDVLTGVNGYTIYYRRENGATVVDTVIVNSARNGIRVNAHYAPPK